MSHSRTSSLIFSTTTTSSAAPAAHANTTTTTNNNIIDDSVPAKGPAPLHRRSTAPVTSSTALESSSSSTTKLARNVAPGLLARMKFLNQGSGVSKQERTDIGRIDDGTIRKLDDFHKDRSFSIERRGQAWSGISQSVAEPVVPHPAAQGNAFPLLKTEPRDDSDDDGDTNDNDNDNSRVLDSKPESSGIGRIDESTLRKLDHLHARERNSIIERRGTVSHTDTPLIPQLTGETVPTLVMEPDCESEGSSVISTSDKALPSGSEVGMDDVLDMQKYRLPDITATKSLLPQPVCETSYSGGNTATTEPTQAPTPSKDPSVHAPPSHQDIPMETASEASLTSPLLHAASQDSPWPTSREAPQQTLRQAVLQDASVLDDYQDIDIESYFQRRHLRSTGSIYSLSKASFTNQIQGLTSMQLPPTTIASEITALPTSTLAARALHKAANDIRLWMAKAAEVLNGLDAEDDVEWAAAAGREGLAEVDAAIGKFEGLVTVFISAIEDLQARPDIQALPARDLTTLVSQMEDIVNTWSRIKQTLQGIKNQVEMAMEWEELWNKVLGEIGHEIEELGRHVFEMEERRHRVISDSIAEAPEKFDIADLESIVEETPRPSKVHNHRFSLPATLLVKSPVSPIPQIEQENSRLLSLFAKLQPLRASLDFLPMRLASFHSRASTIFPSACSELKQRKEQLEQQEKKLEADAEALREELGEDKWVHSFRQAGSKAVALYDSCMKSVQKMQQAMDDHDEEKMLTRIATYTDKRDHYPPSMRRVLELIDMEMKHRSTVNGEILRIQQDVRAKVLELEAVIADTDKMLDEFGAARQLRDSISTTLSAQTEGSVANSNFATPNSSPASSVVMSRKSSGQVDAPPSGKPRLPIFTASRGANLSNRRHSSVFSGVVPRKGSGPTYIEGTTFRSITPTQPRYAQPPPTHATEHPKTDKPAAKPRWNSSTNMKDTVVGHNFKPMSLTVPSPHRKTERSVSSQSHIPVRSPLGRSTFAQSQVSSSRSPSAMPTRQPSASPMQSPKTPAAAAYGKLPVLPTPGSTPRLSPGTAGTGSDESPAARRAIRSVSAANHGRSNHVPTKKRNTSASSLASMTEATTSARSASRLAHVEKGTNGHESSHAEKPPWR